MITRASSEIIRDRLFHTFQAVDRMFCAQMEKLNIDNEAEKGDGNTGE